MLDNLIKYICDWEEFRAIPYYATAYEEKQGMLTVGYGFKYNKGIKVQNITQRSALGLLAKKLIDLHTQLGSPPYDPVDNKTDWISDAVVALAYNLGPKGFPRLLNCLQEGDNDGAYEQFFDGIYQGKNPITGLMYRRACDAQIFKYGIYEKREYITQAESEIFLKMNSVNQEAVNMINKSIR